VSALPSVSRAPATEDARSTVRELYERHGQRVLTYCISRLRNLDEAQDATQTTFLLVLRALDRGQRPRSELAWLLGIAHNVCLSAQRTLSRRNARTTYADIDELEAAAVEIGDDNEDLLWLRGALERLPENQRKAILLREWQGLSYADMATELGLSIPAVEALLFRARRDLAAQRSGSKRLRGALDLASLGLALRSVRKGAMGKAAALGAGVTLATTPFAVAEVAAKRVSPARRFQAAQGASRTAATREAWHPRHRVRAAASHGNAVAGPATEASTPALEGRPAAKPPQQPPPQAQPPGGVELPPVPPLAPLPPVVADVLAQVPTVPTVIQDATGTVPAVGG
jgi:RNA polymerase sigma factor (sigma-70 family)